MRWRSDLEGVPRQLVDGKWEPKPIDDIWKNKCWTCKFTTNRTFLTVTCTVTSKRKIPCAECDVPDATELTTHS